MNEGSNIFILVLCFALFKILFCVARYAGQKAEICMSSAFKNEDRLNRDECINTVSFGAPSYLKM